MLSAIELHLDLFLCVFPTGRSYFGEQNVKSVMA